MVKSGDLEMLQDLVTAAVNAAVQKVDEPMQSTSAACWAEWECDSDLPIGNL